MNLLIVGNGFDRKIGLKTDYISFLEWMKNEGYGMGSRLKKAADSIINYNIINFKSKADLVKNNFFTYDTFKTKYFNLRNPNGLKIFDDEQENKLSNQLLYALPEILNTREDNIKDVEPNIWYCFMQILLFEKKNRVFNINISRFESFINENGKWIDIEGLIQANVYLRIMEDYYKDGFFSLTEHFDVFSLAHHFTLNNTNLYQRGKEDIYEIVWKDFLEFKGILCQYFTSLQTSNVSFYQYEKHCNNYKSIHSDNLEKVIIDINEYSSIINFNYTNYVINSSNSNNCYYVHGNVTDFKRVVFGFDVNIKNGVFDKDERKTSFEIALSKNKSLNRFSKVNQLFELQVDKQPYINRGLIRELSIVGHSIGEQDYSYYFSLLDRKFESYYCVDLVTIIGLWYTFGDNNNKDEMKESLFEMLTHYERYANKKVLHRMIFEGRIKFKEVYIPQLV